MENENIVGGYYGDPMVYYGPSAMNRGTGTGQESQVYGTPPLWGPVNAPNAGLPSPTEFFTSPAGIVTIALFGGYLLWRNVFGD